MEKRLSSLFVPLYKLIFVSIGAIGIYSLIRDVKNINIAGLLFMAGWLAIWHFGTNHWKRVHLKNQTLYISNYLKTIEVPVSEVARIEASNFWGWQPQTITLKLKSPTVFGQKIVFVPNGGWMYAEAYADKLRRDLELT